MEALLPLIITFGLMWALLIRPQQRRVRLHQELVATLGSGDEVITTGGIVGTIVSVVDDIVTLEVAAGVSVRVLRSAIQTRISPYAAEDAVEADAYGDEIDGDDIDGDDIDGEDDLFDENQFDAEPVAEPSAADPPRDPASDSDTTYIPPPPSTTPPSTTPPSTTPPSTNPPPTGEKA